MNKLAILAVSILVFCGAMLWYLASADWNGFIRSQVSLHGTAITEQTVAINDVSVQLDQGFIALTGLAINNPNGFSDNNALIVENIQITLNPQNINQSPIVIDSLVLDKVHVVIEYNQEKVSNYQQIVAQINNQIVNRASIKAQQNPPGKKPKKQKRPPAKLVINHFKVTNITLNFASTNDNQASKTLEFSNITRNDIGGEQGITPSELSAVIAETLFNELNVSN
jgi:uncharacterized protein involved in outer membrane biogenesis